MNETPAPEQEILLGIEFEITALFQAGRSALRDYSRLFHPELQPTGFTILRLIFACEPAQAGTVIQQTGLDKSAVSRQIRVLRDLGLIETRPDPLDGRSNFLVPTPLAEERMERLRQRVKKDYRDRLAGWTHDDLVAFSRFLERFNSSNPAA